jgi:hypothetical protein
VLLELLKCTLAPVAYDSCCGITTWRSFHLSSAYTPGISEKLGKPQVCTGRTLDLQDSGIPG